MTISTPQPAVAQRVGTQARRSPARAAVVAGTTAATAAAWSIVTIGFDETVYGPSFDGAPPSEVGIVAVMVAALTASLAGWIFLAALERWTARPVGLWTGVAVTAVMFSLGGPLSGVGVTAGDRITLLAVHLFVAALYIPLMRTTVLNTAELQR